MCENFKIGQKVRVRVGQGYINNDARRTITEGQIYTVLDVSEYENLIKVTEFNTYFDVRRFELVTDKIPKVGLYKNALGEKVEIVSIKGNKAMGWIGDSCGIWSVLSGISVMNVDIIGEWQEPETITGKVYVRRGSDGNLFLSFDSTRSLAEKEVTFTV